ncbi:hypothetical protein ACWCPY_43230, partial [Streptomyces sp. NPDC002403]
PAMREEDLGRHSTTHLPPIEDLARTIRQLAGEQTGAQGLGTNSPRAGLPEQGTNQPDPDPDGWMVGTGPSLGALAFPGADEHGDWTAVTRTLLGLGSEEEVTAEHHEQAQRFLADLSLQAPPPIPAADASPPTEAMDWHPSAEEQGLDTGILGARLPEQGEDPGGQVVGVPGTGPAAGESEDSGPLDGQQENYSLGRFSDATWWEVGGPSTVVGTSGGGVGPSGVVSVRTGSHTPADQDPAPPTTPPATADQAGSDQTHYPASPAPLNIEDLARTIRQLAGERTGVHLDALTTHLRGQQKFEHLDLKTYEIRSVLQAAGISVQKFTGLDDDKQRERLGVRVDALGGHGLAHLPTIEDLARTIRELAAADNHRGVHLDALAAHLRQKEGVIRDVLEVNGINVHRLGQWFGGERRFRLGVRVDALGGHGLAHLPAVEDLARTIRQLAATNNHRGVHLAILAARLGLEEGMIRDVLAAHGVTVESLKLLVGGKRLKRLGVRVDALGRHGLAENGPGELPRDTSDQPGRTAPQETTDPAGPGHIHHPALLPPVTGDLTRAPHAQAAANHQDGVHPTNHAPHPDRLAETIPQTIVPGTTSDRVFAALNPTEPTTTQ